MGEAALPGSGRPNSLIHRRRETGLLAISRTVSRACQSMVALAPDFAAISFIVFCVALFLKDAILFGQVYWEPDTLTYYYPATRQLNDAIRRGDFQLWTPHILNGFFIFADGETGALYPPRVLALLFLSAEDALAWNRAIRLILAGSFAYFYARQIGLRRCASLIAGLVFCLGSFLVAQLHHSNLSNTAIWLPFILLFIERGLRSVGLSRYISLSIAGTGLGLACLGIHLQPAMMIVLASGLYTGFRVFTGCAGQPRFGERPGPPIVASGSRRLERESLVVAILGLAAWAGGIWQRLRLIALAVGVIVIVGLSLAAAQLLPLFELTRYSFRGYNLPYEYSIAFALSPHNLLSLIFPYFFRTADGTPWSYWTQWEVAVYVGILPLALSVIAIRAVHNRYVLFFAGMGLVSGLLCLGGYLPAGMYRLAWQLPGISLMRAPGRFSLLLVFSLAVLAGFGAQWLMSSGWSDGRLGNLSISSRKIRKWGLLILIGVILLMAGALGLREWLSAHPDEARSLIQAHYLQSYRGNYLLTVETAYQGLIHNLDLRNPNTQFSLAWLALTGALLVSWPNLYRWNRHAAPGLIVLFTAGDLLLFASHFHPLVSVQQISMPSPAASFLIKNNGLHRIHTAWPCAGTDPNRLLPYGVSAVGGYSSLQPERHRHFNRLIVEGKHYRLLNLMGVRYVVAADDTGGWAANGYRLVYKDDSASIFENPHFLPRAMLIPTVTVATKPGWVPELLIKRQLALDRTAVLEETQFPYRDPIIQSISIARSGLEAAAQVPSPGQAEVIEYGLQRVLVKVRAERNSLLLLTDSYHRGWKAYVDGVPSKVWVADYLFRGVTIPAGEHEVLFVFDPASFKAGVAISIGALLCLIAFWAFSWLRLGTFRMHIGKIRMHIGKVRMHIGKEEVSR